MSNKVVNSSQKIPKNILENLESLNSNTGSRQEMQNHLLVKDLHKSYGKRQILFGIDMEIKSGEVVGILGPNGAGKTTCFYMIAGLVKVDKGLILFNDIDITESSIHQRSAIGIGYLPQEASLFRGMSVEENIYSIIEIVEKTKTRREKLTILSNILEEFSISHIRKSNAMSLSGGERRRVEIARAIVANPAILLLDEPFAGIDPISVFDIISVINRLKQKGIGILITDHNVRETLDVVDFAYIVYDGKVIAKGNKTEILANDMVRKVYLGEEFK